MNAYTDKLTAAGFKIANMGGNCQAWIKERADHWYVAIGDDGAGLPEPDSVIWVGLHGPDGDASDDAIYETTSIDEALAYAAGVLAR